MIIKDENPFVSKRTKKKQIETRNKFHDDRTPFDANMLWKDNNSTNNNKKLSVKPLLLQSIC
jgi:hypothetical protein